MLSKKHIARLTVDLQNGFDCASYNKLLYKSQLCGISGAALNGKSVLH